MGTSVAQLITTAERRGAEVFGVELGAELAKRGAAVSTWALRGSTSTARLDVPTISSGAPWSMVSHLRRLARDADIVIGHGSRTLLAGSAAVAGTRRPFVYRSIGDPAYWANDRRRRAVVRGALRLTQAVCVVYPRAAEVLQDMYALPSERIHVIPRGVPDGHFQPETDEARARSRTRLGLPRDAPVIAYVGALSPEKNVAAALEAVAGMSGVHLVVAGDGPLRTTLEHAREGRARIHLLGAVADPRPVFTAADAVVLPSHTEGTPGVLIEAGLSGVPAVATDVGGVGTILEDGVTGRLVPPPAEVTALREALHEVLRDHCEMGRCARLRCLDRFSLGVVGDAWQRLILQVAADESVPAGAS